MSGPLQIETRFCYLFTTIPSLFNKVGVVVQFMHDVEDRGRGISQQEIFILLFSCGWFQQYLYSVPRCSQVKVLGKVKLSLCQLKQFLKNPEELLDTGAFLEVKKKWPNFVHVSP